MPKKKRDKAEETYGPRQVGGLADTNMGIVLGELVATRSWMIVILAILLGTMFVRAVVGLGGYSGTSQNNTYQLEFEPTVGCGVPPLYGDFEAQRHWMELTLHVPLKEWYYHDKQWWGLDYPPLTAYVSLLFAKLYLSFVC
jgi:hypothetical protein